MVTDTNHSDDKFENESILRYERYSEDDKTMWDRKIFHTTSGKFTNLRSMWKESGRRLLGDQWDKLPRAGLAHYTIDKTSNALENIVGIQYGAGWRLKIGGRESGAAPQWAMPPRAGRKLKAAAATNEMVAGIVEQFTPEQLKGDEFFGEELAEVLRELAQPIADPETGEQIADAPFNLDHMTLVNGKLFGDVAQDIWDDQFSDANGDEVFLQLVTNMGSFGHQPSTFEFNIREKQMYVGNPTIVSVVPDRYGTRIKEFRHLRLEEELPIRTAKAQFPHVAEELERAKDANTDVRDERTTTTAEANASTTETTSDLVRIVTVWERYHEYEMEPYEAIDLRLVEPVEVDGDVRYRPTEKLKREVEARMRLRPEDVDEENQAGEDDERAAGDEEKVETGDDGFIDEDSEDWPMVTGIRQYKYIADYNIEIEDVRCPYWDIPMLWTKNGEIAFGPYAKSEPLKLEDVQMGINKLWTMIYNIILYNQSPQQIMSEGMYNAMKKAGVAIHARPDRVIVVPDMQYLDMLKGKGPLLNVDPPSVPESLVKILEIMLRIHDELSRSTAAVQGRAPFSGASGKLQAELREASASPMQTKSLYVEFSLERLARLCLHAVGKYFDEEDYGPYLAKYPPVVRRYVAENFRSQKLKFNAFVASGRGGSREREHDQTRADFAAGLLPLVEALSRLDVKDPKETARQILEERAGMVGGAPTQPGTAAPALPIR